LLIVSLWPERGLRERVMQRSSSQNVGNDLNAGLPGTQRVDPGLAAISLIAGYYRVAADDAHLQHQLALTGRLAGAEDLVRASRLLELKLIFYSWKSYAFEIAGKSE